jgi:hypothetical protein
MGISCSLAVRRSRASSSRSASRGAISRPAHARVAPSTGSTLARKGMGADGALTWITSGSGRGTSTETGSAAGLRSGAKRVMASVGQAAMQAWHSLQSA